MHPVDGNSGGWWCSRDHCVLSCVSGVPKEPQPTTSQHAPVSAALQAPGRSGNGSTAHACGPRSGFSHDLRHFKVHPHPRVGSQVTSVGVTPVGAGRLASRGLLCGGLTPRILVAANEARGPRVHTNSCRFEPRRCCACETSERAVLRKRPLTRRQRHAVTTRHRTRGCVSLG